MAKLSSHTLRETTTISIKPDLKKVILKRAEAEFDSVSKYIRKLVLADGYRLREMEKKRNRTWEWIALRKRLPKRTKSE